jgi:hypothetical protein
MSPDASGGHRARSIADGVLPDSILEGARRELRRRLETPGTVDSGRQRARLAKRLERLQKQHEWGDLSDAGYVRARDVTKAALAGLPDGDRTIAFDIFRARVLDLRDSIAVASPARQEELCRILIEEVAVLDRHVAEITWTPAARPFFEKRQRVCPQGDSDTRPLSDDDPLAWYVA